MGRLRLVLIAAGLLLLAGGLVGFGLQAGLLLNAPAAEASGGLALSLEITRTPFQPAKPTTAAGQAVPTDEGPQPAAPGPYGEHFARGLLQTGGETVRLDIQAPPGVHGGQAIQIPFRPGKECPFGLHTACVSQHRGGQVILLTVHSGVGGEGERFRDAVEGSGIDAAGFEIGQIRTNLAALRGAAVSVLPESALQGRLHLAEVVRVHPMDLPRYFDLPFDDALAMLADENEGLRELLDSGRPLLAFEICGWHVQGEVWAAGFPGTSASIYLGLIQASP